uniref:AP2/ERF domain-containing protein n=1 Tax=Oryza brachyantha TaxID=4533 RepID=J3LCC5_ORYBR
MDNTSCLVDDASSDASTGKKAPATIATTKALQCLGSSASAAMDATDPGVEADSGGEWRVDGAGSCRRPRTRAWCHNGTGWWGMQIYEWHQRVWLGTFIGEEEVAHAYDVAAQRFRDHDAVSNFRPLDEFDPKAAVELRFLASRSKTKVLTCPASTPTSRSSQRTSATSPPSPRCRRTTPVVVAYDDLCRRGVRAPVRQDNDAQRRGEVEPTGDPEAARREVIPTIRAIERAR